ncbi:hypothetical protein ACTFIV_001007 [Dictyostelium citrinum]
MIQFNFLYKRLELKKFIENEESITLDEKIWAIYSQLSTLYRNRKSLLSKISNTSCHSKFGQISNDFKFVYSFRFSDSQDISISIQSNFIKFYAFYKNCLVTQKSTPSVSPTTASTVSSSSSLITQSIDSQPTSLIEQSTGSLSKLTSGIYNSVLYVFKAINTSPSSTVPSTTQPTASSTSTLSTVTPASLTVPSKTQTITPTTKSMPTMTAPSLSSPSTETSIDSITNNMNSFNSYTNTNVTTTATTTTATTTSSIKSTTASSSSNTTFDITQTLNHSLLKLIFEDSSSVDSIIKTLDKLLILFPHKKSALEEVKNIIEESKIQFNNQIKSIKNRLRLDISKIQRNNEIHQLIKNNIMIGQMGYFLKNVFLKKIKIKN